ncbi:MAG: SEC-C metal-binding domain-containing protein [Candidatus Krumholzibacteriia bacterium]
MSPDRNDPCPCGSGRKYKKCCLAKEASAGVVEAGVMRMRRTEGELVTGLARQLSRYYGPGALDAAWAEYTLWPDPPADRDEWPEFDTSFPVWLLFDWEPDPNEPGQSEGRPAMAPALHYAQRKGSSLDSYERHYIEEVCRRPFTFYLVVAPVPGREITLRDIFRQREVTVRERQASATLRPGQIVFTKVVTLDGDTVMLGCAPYAIPGRNFDAIVELREHIARHREMTDETLRAFDSELRQLYLDLREDVVDPAPPSLQNTDGDPLQMTRLDYELDCPPQEAFNALLPLALADDPAAFEDEAERDRAGGLVAVQFPWLKLGNAQHAGWENTVLGQFEIRGRALRVNVNSQARAEAIRAEISARLGPRARAKGVVIESVEKLMSAAAARGAPEARTKRAREKEELERNPEIQAMLAEMGAKHWHAWPDTPLPALGGQTPRRAAATAAGRERLEVLFLEFAAHEGTPDAMRPDIAALRRELRM